MKKFIVNLLGYMWTFLLILMLGFSIMAIIAILVS
nr:MAG TPA: hypothetical protein [Caudoviricetes sp.]